MRSRLLALTLLSTLGLCGVASAATQPVIIPASTSVSLGTMKVKGYTMSVSASEGSGGGLYIFLSKGPQSHSYAFGKKSFSLQIPKSLGAGSLSAHLGKYGHFTLRFAATGVTRASKLAHGCTGPKTQTRPWKVTSSSGSIVLDKTFFRTVRIGHVKAGVTKTGKLKCTFKTQPPGPNTRSLSVTSSALSAFFSPGNHSTLATVTVTTSNNPEVSHTISLKGPSSNLTIQSDASAATVKSFGPLLTGTGSYKASQFFTDGSSGALTGTLVAHFDSIGAQKVQGSQAFLSVPGFSPPPTANFSAGQGGVPGEEDFTDESSGNGASIVAWSWTFGDNTTSSLQNPSHVYTTSGTYTVSLTVTDNHGKKASVSQNVTVTANQPPISSFTVDTSPGGYQVNFQDNSSDPDPNGGVVAWSWNFGDGTTSTLQNPSHTYAGPGPYTVTLTVTDNSGAQSSSSQSVSPSP